ncbi:hypothetical protein NSK_004088 [Nannochloropsis salina CCMP1776]|uniref:EKC/KEOPS complex subunit CGI121 n=1 Tax=Nannochloropsis salina CCMP1776 TaxID=1027361 RepID=A0A4D9D3N2_9STRA|nr:hypothetical protein NSK_004088 [Nannochloropsis salina CCMP1776]|eukprot:TFJ84623.1 hypothetical protein NSK_004088 [Nannochloropsis salina CCMP1776]
MISWDASRAAPVEVSASGNKDSGSSNEANGNHSESFVFKTTLFPEKHTLCLLLFQDVKNASAVRETLLAGNSPDFALINPDMIFSSFHLLLAASIALLHANQGTMRVKTLHAELLYSLSPTTSISEAFRIFGGGGGRPRQRRTDCSLPSSIRPSP